MVQHEAYFEIHDYPMYPRRGKRKRANMYDKNADKRDLDYMEDYGL